MQIKTEELHALFAQAVQSDNMRLSDLPNIDLYMDQIISLFNQELSGHKRNAQDKIMTKTMINNYSKVGLLKPIKGKKYSKNHLILLLLIFELKQSLSIQDIKKLLECEKEQMSDDTGYRRDFLAGIYEQFLQQKERQKELLPQLNKALFIEQEKQDLLFTALTYCAISACFKSAAEKLIDMYDQG